MSAKADLIMTLGKVIIAAAWADGEVAIEEINSLKDLLFRLPELNARQWAALDIYIDTVVDENERARLAEELRALINTPADQKLAIDTIEELIRADGVVTEEERRVADQLRSVIESVDVSIFGQIGRLFAGPVQRRSQIMHNREVYLDDFIRNRVYYGVQRRLNMDADIKLNIPDDQLRKLSLIGGLLASIAHVDNQITDEEFETIVNALKSHAGIEQPAATFVAEVATQPEMAKLDGFRLAREALAVMTPAEMESLLDVLFEVAAADGMADADEIQEIRTIAGRLKLSNDQFIQAKLKIPKEKRES